MKILISGAGIAGLTAAYWLKRHGFTPSIIERAPELLTGGYKIDVRGKALEILHRMDIYDAVIASNTDMQGALLIDKQGKVLHEMSGDEFWHRAENDIEISRGKLCQILMDKIPDVECIFGDVIQKISPSVNGLEVKFKNEIREFDLVIGADGLHSNVRQLVFGNESAFLHNLG
jgi:2-polyprenyl-6-methoxyphenol hydroxylase-like FAD-dependent oxidoreductase